jgi:hypothetical protein
MEDPHRLELSDILWVDLVDVLKSFIGQSISVVSPVKILLGERRANV